MNRIGNIILQLLVTVAFFTVTFASHAEIPVKRMSQWLAALRENPDDINALINAGQIYMDLCDYDGSRRIANRLEDIACRYPDSIMALYYGKFIHGCTNAMSGHCNEAVTQLTQALSVAESNSMLPEIAKANNALGFCYVNYDRDFSEGLDVFNIALKAARESGSQQLTSIVLNNLADAYLWRHDFSGIRFVEEALNISRNCGDSYGMLLSYLNIAHFKCYYQGLMNDVPDLLRKARNIQAEYGYLPDGEIELVQGRYYMSQGDYDKAVQLFNKVLEESSSQLTDLLRIKLNLYSGWACTMIDRDAEAIAAYDKALSHIKATGYDSFLLKALSGASYCYQELGDAENALDYLLRYQRRLDSLYITEQFVTLNRCRLENEALLNETKIERQTIELNTRQKYIIVLSAVGAMLLAVVCLMWYFYRRKERLIRSVVARERESLVRERLLRQALEQARSESEVSDKSPGSAMAEEKIEDIMMQFNELMSDRKAYTDSNISIKSVAEQLHTNRTYLSQAINRTFGKSFPQVLAEYRIRAAIEMMSDPDCSLPLKAIAAEVGFSSPSVFFTTFRNIMGMTPAAYRSGQGV